MRKARPSAESAVGLEQYTLLVPQGNFFRTGTPCLFPQGNLFVSSGELFPHGYALLVPPEEPLFPRGNFFRPGTPCLFPQGNLFFFPTGTPCLFPQGNLFVPSGVCFPPVPLGEAFLHSIPCLFSPRGTFSARVHLTCSPRGAFSARAHSVVSPGELFFPQPSKVSPGKGQKMVFWSCFSVPWHRFPDFGLVFGSPVRTYFGCRFFPLWSSYSVPCQTRIYTITMAVMVYTVGAARVLFSGLLSPQ